MQKLFERDGHLPYVARRRNMRKSALAVLLAWTLAAQQGLCGKLEKIAQQPSNILMDYTTYGTVSIIHFNVPERTVVVVFKYVLFRNMHACVFVISLKLFYHLIIRIHNFNLNTFKNYRKFITQKKIWLFEIVILLNKLIEPRSWNLMLANIIYIWHIYEILLYNKE